VPVRVCGRGLAHYWITNYCGCFQGTWCGFLTSGRGPAAHPDIPAEEWYPGCSPLTSPPSLWDLYPSAVWEGFGHTFNKKKAMAGPGFPNPCLSLHPLAAAAFLKGPSAKTSFCAEVIGRRERSEGPFCSDFDDRIRLSLWGRTLEKKKKKKESCTHSWPHVRQRREKK